MKRTLERKVCAVNSNASSDRVRKRFFVRGPREERAQRFKKLSFCERFFGFLVEIGNSRISALQERNTLDLVSCRRPDYEDPQL